MTDSLMHTTCLLCGKHAVSVPWNLEGLPYANYSYCPDCIRKGIKLLKEQGWHTLTEDDDGIIHGLPGDDGQYLMTDGKDIWIDDFVNGVSDGIFLDSGRDVREIMAWMYMPEIPKKDRR